MLYNSKIQFIKICNVAAMVKTEFVNWLKLIKINWIRNVATREGFDLLNSLRFINKKKYWNLQVGSFGKVRVCKVIRLNKKN